MRTTEIWVLLAILFGAVVGSLWIPFDFYRLSEVRAWPACIKENDPASAQKLDLPLSISASFQTMGLEYQGKTDATKGG